MKKKLVGAVAAGGHGDEADVASVESHEAVVNGMKLA